VSAYDGVGTALEDGDLDVACHVQHAAGVGGQQLEVAVVAKHDRDALLLFLSTSAQNKLHLKLIYPF
jgi:hypothetical protein